MYATFTPTGGAAVALSDSANLGEDFVGITDDSQKQIDVAMPLRAAGVITLDRGNLKFHRSWLLQKIFATVDAAESWLADTRAAVSCVGLTPPSGTLTLYVRNQDGSIKSSTVANANLQISLVRYMGGATFEFRLEVTGGAQSAYT